MENIEKGHYDKLTWDHEIFNVNKFALYNGPFPSIVQQNPDEFTRDDMYLYNKLLTAINQEAQDERRDNPETA